MKKIKTIFFAIFIFSVSLLGKEEDYTFKQIKMEDGLSQSTVTSILQDAKGYMWFATPNGLNKYDGYNFTLYTNDPSDSTSISDNSIVSLMEDADGIIWIGTSDGVLNRFNRQTEKFERIYLENSLGLFSRPKIEYYEYPLTFSRFNNASLTSIAADDNGIIWIGTWANGLLSFDKNSKEIKHYFNNPTDKSSLSSNRIAKVIIDEKGTVWIGTFGGGLNKMLHDGDRIYFQTFQSIPGNNKSLSDDKVISLYNDDHGNLWIGTFYGGLNFLESNNKYAPDAQNKFIRFQEIKNDTEKLPDNTIMAITGDNLGYIWIGTFGGGLNRYDPETKSFKRFNHDPFSTNSLADDDVLSLWEDRSGTIWIGSHLGEGISKLEMNTLKFNLIRLEAADPNSLNDAVVWSIKKNEEEDILWIGTYRGGLNKYDRKKNEFSFYKYSPDNSSTISDNHVRSIAEDGFGNVWLGTYAGGLNKFNPKTGAAIRYKHHPDDPVSIGANQVQDILVDSFEIWLATFGGGLNVFQYNGDNKSAIKFKSFKNDISNPKSISDNRAYSLFLDSKKVLWVGTFGGGLNKFIKEDSSFIRYMHNSKEPGSLSDNRVLSIFEDSKSRYWIGTYGGGLNRFDPAAGVFERYGPKNGLNAEVIYGVMEDSNGHLWMSSNNGLFQYDPDNGIFKRYDAEDGLQSLEFNGGAFHKSSSGEMFFGGINGLNYFYPERLPQNEFLPPVVISQIKIFNYILKGEPAELELRYNQNFLTFEFASLDYSNPADNKYAYMLEGLDKDWLYTNARLRIASYTNLSPGTYVFRVMGSNSDGLWNNDGAKIIITISPPFWKTWWFITLAILFIAGVIYYISTIRIKNLLAIEKLKTKLAADLHDNIGSGLTEISILSELVAKDSGSLNGSTFKLKHISEIARQLVDNLSDIVWVVNPKRDSLGDLIARIKDFYSDFLSSLGISLRTNNIEKLNDIKLSMEYRQNLYLIIKEGISNSIKHSKCKKIFLEVNVRGDVIEIVLKDDGIGIENANGLGNGIKNIEERAKNIGGKVKWKSAANDGTSIIYLGKITNMNKLRHYFNN
jgi:ligand-binding sensor domain-containing protein